MRRFWKYASLWTVAAAAPSASAVSLSNNGGRGVGRVVATDWGAPPVPLPLPPPPQQQQQQQGQQNYEAQQPSAGNVKWAVVAAEGEEDVKKENKVTAVTAAAAATTEWPLQCFQVQSPVLLPQGAVVGGGEVVGMPPGPLPSCSSLLMDYHFGNSYGHPFVGQYEPPACSFTRVILNFTVVSEGRQFDRLATMYLGDVEVWRTSTAEPKSHPGIAWTYLKDMTPYLSLWKQPQTLIFDLGNLIDDKYTGLFNTTLTATFIDDTIRGPEAPPADQILALSKRRGAQGMPSAFTYPQDDASLEVEMPQRNVVRAVVSVAANGQADEEFWWSNVPDSSTGVFNSTGTGPMPGHSSFREVQLYIDGQLAGLAWPFPVVFTGGVSPPLHRPIVGLQAFDIREQEIDITPWLGLLCDGAAHTFMFRIVDAANLVVPSYWVVSGKVFLWLDEADTAAPLQQQNHPVVQLSKPDYNAGPPTALGDGSFRYTQNIRRVYSVTSTLVRNGRPSLASWSQSFTMQNNGYLADNGNFQQVNAIYTGQDTASLGHRTTFHAAYSYPIDMILNTTGPTPDYALHISAQLYQGLELTITGATVFSTGLEPFMHKLPSSADPQAAGSTVSTFRKGSADFYQLEDGRSSSGQGEMRQVFRFGATNNAGPTGAGEAQGGNFVFAPLLYLRDVTAENEVITQDEQYVYKQDTPPHSKVVIPLVAPGQGGGAAAAAAAAGSGGSGGSGGNGSEFAPLPAMQRGGVKVFFGTDIAEQVGEFL